MIRLLPIEAATYVRSPLHAEDRFWPETNCYVDLWIELLNGLGLDPVPALGFTLSVDFEGDQWQFFKFPLEDLREFFGIDAAEMNPWRGVEYHVEEQLLNGRLLTVEVDAWYLPDTAGVSYRREHVKSSIVPNMLDREGHRLGYFHGSSYYELEGDDYTGIFRHDIDDPNVLPPYVELVKLDGLRRPPPDEVLRHSVRLVESHLRRRPTTNPVFRFRKRFEQDLAWVRGEDLTMFHLYSFATLRQFGACCELSASLCSWLADRGEPVSEAAVSFSEIASQAKAAQFKLARLASGRDVDLDPLLEDIEQRWEAAFAIVGQRYG
jgi:Domain of unknown function (DUF1839)